MSETDVVIVGGGVMGLSCAWRLAEAGRSVILLERFTFGHDRGSSHGPTRIFRFSYDHPRYVAMARTALPLWRELEAFPNELLRITGGIEAGDPSALTRCTDALAAEGARFEWLEPDAVGERYPWCALPGPVLASPDTGVIHADATLARLRARAMQAGADLRERSRVLDVEQDDDGVTISAEDGRVRARWCVLAAGAWVGPMLSSVGSTLPLRVTDEHVSYVDGPPDTVPVIWRRERFFYTVPSFDGSGVIKVGEHVGGDDVDPDARDHRPPDIDPLASWATDSFPSFGPLQGRGERCLYTITPDEDFVLDRLGRMIVVSACSGHGFKFAPLVGAIVESLVAARAPSVPLDAFSLSRF